MLYWPKWRTGARQDSKIGIESFIKNGVRPTLIPLLISYFQERNMTVKWHGLKSSTYDLLGGGPQGCTFGLLEYKSSSNNNNDHVPVKMRFRFVDDLSILEKLNIILLGLSSYNVKQHVASDIGTNQKIFPNRNIQSQRTSTRLKTGLMQTKLNSMLRRVM